LVCEKCISNLTNWSKIRYVDMSLGVERNINWEALDYLGIYYIQLNYVNLHALDNSKE
jgi:hypothetical protein